MSDNEKSLEQLEDEAGIFLAMPKEMYVGEVKQILDRLKPAKQAVSTDKLKIKPKK